MKASEDILNCSERGADRRDAIPSPAEAGETAVSFLITNYNMRRLVEECLNHLTDHMKPTGLSYEILLADNSSDPEFALDETTCERWPNVRFTRIRNSSGWVDALNALLPQAHGDLVCIMHPDIEFEGDCVSQCVAFLNAHADVAVAAPNPYRSDGKPGKARLRFPSLSADARRLANLLSYLVCRRRPLAEERYWDRSASQCVDSVLSFCFFCRGDMLRSIAPIEVGLVSWFANDYICLQAHKTGHRVMYLKEPRIVHYERRTPRKLYGASTDMQYKGSAALGSPGMQRDRLRFIRCSRGACATLAFKAITITEFGLHALVAFLKGGSDAKGNCAAYLDVVRIAFRA